MNDLASSHTSTKVAEQGFESSYAGSTGCTLNTALKYLWRTDGVHLRVWVLEAADWESSLRSATWSLCNLGDMVTEPTTWNCSED